MEKNRKFIIFLLVLVFLTAGVLWARGQYVVPVIMYHRVDEKAGISKMSVSPESFRRQMMFLKENNYNVVSLKTLAGLVKDKKIPPKTIAITFDDGYENNYKNAYPVLKELRFPATIFISPSLIGIEDYLRWDQVIEMSESGVVSIGSHSMTHAYLKDFQDKRLYMEIAESKRAIESHTRSEIYSFSYPLGGFNENIREDVKKAGYKIAVATNPGKEYPKHDLFAMKRVRISRTSDNLLVFWIETSGFYTWIKEHRDD